jgi:hypothetical protein
VSIVGSELILFTEDSYSTAPDCPGIYILYDSHHCHRPLYVGQASNLRKRIYDWYVGLASWLGSFGVDTWFQFCKTDDELCDHYEILLTQLLNPLKNRLRSSSAFDRLMAERTQRVMEGLKNGSINPSRRVFSPTNSSPSPKSDRARSPDVHVQARAAKNSIEMRRF